MTESNGDARGLSGVVRYGSMFSGAGLLDYGIERTLLGVRQTMTTASDTITDEQLGRALRTIISNTATSGREPEPARTSFYEKQMVEFASSIDRGEWRWTTQITRVKIAIEPSEDELAPLGLLEHVIEWITGTPVAALGAPKMSRAAELAAAWIANGQDPDELPDGLIMWLRIRMTAYAKASKDQEFEWDEMSMSEWIALDLFSGEGDAHLAMPMMKIAGLPSTE